MRVIVAEEEDKLTVNDLMGMDDGQLRARLAEIEAGEPAVAYAPGPSGLDEKRMIVLLLGERAIPSSPFLYPGKEQT